MESYSNEYYEGINQGDKLSRFWNKVEFTTDCWNWTAHKNIGGYGTFKIDNKQTLSHRFSYELYNGQIPKGLVIDHLCRNPQCVNPNHLEAVTQRENIMRGIGIASINIKKTHCPKGHEYNKVNTYILKKGRYCRKCDRISGKKYYIKKRELLN